ncbi:aminoglycoside phosphotransferase family protein [Legionella sp. PATHC038]|uniref:aminoglycoside phosphotransferase family protein n=1 Tax=Legionella sheltonii TaxID=2992041 RepID=UPI002244044C|nr:aminoglycoside phosphotransferase family protein [Legionella sp. PATHC038]MCW8399695.1 aminoglycoside phosphotransferase family protein [Legionella sp. PATHC038]
MPGQPIPEQQLIELLKSNYAINVEDIQSLQLGADMNALVYKVNDSANSYFLKLKYVNHEETHMDVMKLLHDSHVKEIIFPICSVDGKLLKQLNDFKMIVYPFIEGQNGFQHILTKNQWIKLGKTLKQIHTLSIPVALRKSLRTETYSPKWREMVKSLYSQIESDTSTNTMTIDFKKYYLKHFDSINRLVNSAEELVKLIQFDAHEYVLCHADIHAGNILMTSDESFYIIDWDDPMMAPKERDLMFIGGGVGNVWNLSAEVAYFYEGYGEVVINKTILSYYRHERIIEDIALYGLDLLASNMSDQSKRVSLEHFKSMFERNGVVDIAFQGLE